MKKICFVLSASNTFGANGALIELLETLDRKDFQLYAILPSKGPITEKLKSLNIPFEVYPYKWWMRPESQSISRTAIKSILSFFVLPFVVLRIFRWQCDLVYSNTIVIGTGLMAAAILKKPHIFHIHEFGYWDHKLIFNFGKKTTLKLSNRFSKKFIFISRAVEREYSSFVDKSKSVVIYQSVTLPKKVCFQPILEKHSFQLAIVGRIFPSKGQEDAVRAVSVLANNGMDVGLWIVGDGDKKYKDQLNNLIETFHLSEKVLLCGFSDEPSGYVRAADVFLMCSKNEAFGRVTVEAMKCGVAVIGTDSGATPEIIHDKKNGLLYPAGDWKMLAQRIQYLMENKNIKNALARNGLHDANFIYDRSKYATAVTDVLESSLSSKNAI
jgi:glycosyltransferase involved in cell wall biosynthesis